MLKKLNHKRRSLFILFIILIVGAVVGSQFNQVRL